MAGSANSDPSVLSAPRAGSGAGTAASRAAIASTEPAAALSAPLRTLCEAARAAPSADNLQPFFLSLCASSLRIRYATRRLQGRTFPPDHHATRLALGAMLENLFQACQCMRIPYAAQVDDPRASEAEPTLATIHLGALPPPTASLGELDALWDRHTNRFPSARSAMPQEALEELRALKQGPCTLRVLTDRLTIRALADCLRVATVLRVLAPDFLAWIRNSVRFDDNVPTGHEGLDLRTLNLAAGGATCLKLMARYVAFGRLLSTASASAMARQEAKLVAQAPAVVAVLGPQGAQHATAAGRLMQRAWLILTRHRLAVHPYYAVSDQLQRYAASPNTARRPSGAIDKLRHQLARIDLCGEQQTLHMLLRTGAPLRKVARSNRLPLQKLVSVKDPCGDFMR